MGSLGKDFISMKDITEEEILYILDTAEVMKNVINSRTKKSPYLQGKSIITLFDEKISRNRLSYELAGQYLGANIVEMKAFDKSNDYGNLSDLGRIIDQMGGDFIILRHPMSGSAKFLSENVKASVINAGDGINENPSQALLDILTIRENKKNFKDLKVTIIGDISHSRVTRSNIWGLTKLGAKVSISGPSTLIPDELSDLGVEIFYDPYEAVSDCDVILSLKLQIDRLEGKLLPSVNEYKNIFKIDRAMLSHAKEDVIVMHPGPINRGIEISSEIIDSEKCLVDDQIINGVAVRMALLYLLSMRGGANYEIID